MIPESSAWKIAADVRDPEHSGATIGDLGMLRDVSEDDQGRVHVQITPPEGEATSMDRISARLVEALTAAGYQHVDVEFVLAPEPRTLGDTT